MSKIIHKYIIPKEVRCGIWMDYVRKYICTGYLLNPARVENVHIDDKYGSYFWKDVNCKKCRKCRKQKANK